MTEAGSINDVFELFETRATMWGKKKGDRHFAVQETRLIAFRLGLYANTV